MWMAIINSSLSDPFVLFFGNGFSGEVGDSIGVSFRAPHNGFITIFFRMGLFGVLYYLAFGISVIGILGKFASLSSKSKDAAFVGKFGVLNLGAFLGDALTGTIVDSPYTYFLFISSVAASLAFLSNERRRLVEGRGT